MEVNDYRFQGNEGEKVPKRVRKLIVNPGVQVLRRNLCLDCLDLREVTLPQGLTTIGYSAFRRCTILLEITICRTVESIEDCAFAHCHLLTKVEFASSSSSPHQLKTIGEDAFCRCYSLQRITIPLYVHMIGVNAFNNCNVLVEAILSTTSIKEIPISGFDSCRSLQTVSLPNSLERICYSAFDDCSCLVTVKVPLDSQSIEIGGLSFCNCRVLANIVLPQGSHATRSSFFECTLLKGYFDNGADSIVAGLISRFDNFLVHKMCYDHSSTTPQELRLCIEDNEESLVDEFGMTAFHVLFLTAGIGPRGELLGVLLYKFPYNVLGWKDANGKLAMEYLVTNWTPENKTLLQRALQSWMLDPLERWGANSWKEAIESKIQASLVVDDKEQRSAFLTEAHSEFAKYYNAETTSILEVALWKRKIESGWSTNGGKRRALDREECLRVCGSNIVIPNVVMFLDLSVPTPADSNDDDDSYCSAYDYVHDSDDYDY